MISFMSMEAYHGKKGVGSTRLRVHQLIKYWPEAELYRYGTFPEALIFQKVYVSYDFQFPKHFENVKILDICDPDWMDGISIKDTLDAMDGITVPTESLAQFLGQMTNKPIKVIPDRHDIALAPKIKVHKGKIKKAVWFGYSHNAELLRFVVPTLDRLGIELTVISQENPYADRWATEKFKYVYKKFDEETLYAQLQQADICILPLGDRPRDRFKSNNKTVIAWLAGLPVVNDIEMLEKMQSPEARNTEAKLKRELAEKEYDCIISINELKDFIAELKRAK